MFLGGAEQEATRFREASLKGALCFWWRVLNYGKYCAGAAPDTREYNEAIRAFRARETAVFGGPGKQSSFLLKTTSSLSSNRIVEAGTVLSKTGEAIQAPRLVGADHCDPNTIGPGARYLAYGLVDAASVRKDNQQNWTVANAKSIAGRLVRPCIRQNTRLAFNILMRDAQPDINQELIDVIKALGLLGGLGARVRRGLGSLSLRTLDGEDMQISSLADYQKAIEQHFGLRKRHAFKDAQITALSKDSMISISKEEKANPLDVLNDVGEAMQLYRAWGFKGQQHPHHMINGVKAEQNFRDDHDWSKGSRPGHVPLRTAFGLPHAYKSGARVSGPRVTDEPPYDRRASPLFIHIHKLGDDRFCAALSLLPAQFLPKVEHTTGRPKAVAVETKVSNRATNLAYDFERDGLPVLEHFLSQESPPKGDKPFSKKGPYLKLRPIFSREG